MKYGIITDATISVYMIGVLVKISGETDKLYILDDGIPCDMVHKDAIKLISKEEYDLYKVRNRYMLFGMAREGSLEDFMGRLSGDNDLVGQKFTITVMPNGSDTDATRIAVTDKDSDETYYAYLVENMLVTIPDWKLSKEEKESAI